MTQEEVRQQTFQLVALGEVDRRRGEARQLIESVPRVLKARERESDQAQTGVENARAKLLGFKAHLRSLELELAAREQGQDKANANLMTAKTNQEYSLLLGEVARKKEDRGKAEEAILEQYEVIKQGETLVKEADERLVAALRDYKAFEERAQRELGEHQADLAKLDERRQQIRAALGESVLKLYDRALKAHGVGLAAIEQDICQGCFSKLTPNDKSRLVSARELVLCQVCSRIIYMPEVLQASPS